MAKQKKIKETIVSSEMDDDKFIPIVTNKPVLCEIIKKLKELKDKASISKNIHIESDIELLIGYVEYFIAQESIND